MQLTRLHAAAQLVISEIRDSASTGLLAVKLLAQYLTGRKSRVSLGLGELLDAAYRCSADANAILQRRRTCWPR